MDPMQIQNQQGVIPQQQPIPVQQVPMNQPVAGQYVVNQNIPQQPMPVQQPVAQQDSFFDKILKGIVTFIEKLTVSTQNTQATTAGQPTMQPVIQQVPQQQPMPGTGFFGAMGNALENIGNQASQIVQTGTSSVIQGTQNYISDIPQPDVNTQQILAQNYQANASFQQPIPQQPIQPNTINPNIIQNTTNPIPQQPIQPNTINPNIIQNTTNPIPQQPIQQ